MDFAPNKGEQSVPAGYFCYEEVNADFKDFGITSPSKDQSSVLTIFGAYKKVGNRKNRHMAHIYWDNKGVNYAKSWNDQRDFEISGDKSFKVAIINTKPRSIPYEISIARESSWFQFGIWVNSGGWMVLTCAFLVICVCPAVTITMSKIEESKKN